MVYAVARSGTRRTRRTTESTECLKKNSVLSVMPRFLRDPLRSSNESITLQQAP